jgi:ParB-like chromosome segregation protein Spo0J
VKKPTVIKGGKKASNKGQSNERRKAGTRTTSGRTAVPHTPPSTNQGTEPSYKVGYALVNEIKVEGKRRQIHPDKVKDLKQSAAKIGLRAPLTIRLVNGEKHLITGLHRLEAVKSLGWKKVPVVYFKGGAKLARLWEISENLHRAELTAVEESDLIAEWFKLTDAEEEVSAQNGQKKQPGRPKGGISAAAAKLPGKGTVSAKRKQIAGALKIAKIDPEVKQAAVDAGFADNKKKLGEIAEEKGKAAQFKKLQQLKAGSGKDSKVSPKSAAVDDSSFEVLKREWKPTKKWQLAWKKASWKDQTRFVTEVLQYLLDDED